MVFILFGGGVNCNFFIGKQIYNLEWIWGKLCHKQIFFKWLKQSLKSKLTIKENVSGIGPAVQKNSDVIQKTEINPKSADTLADSTLSKAAGKSLDKALQLHTSTTKCWQFLKKTTQKKKRHNPDVPSFDQLHLSLDVQKGLDISRVSHMQHVTWSIF